MIELFAGDTSTTMSTGSGVGLVVIAIILIFAMGGGKKK